MKTELYRTNAKCQGLCPAYFVLILLLFCIYNYSKISISVNKYMQKARESENDTGFLNVIIIAAVHVAS